jgi:hypothetical protein
MWDDDETPLLTVRVGFYFNQGPVENFSSKSAEKFSIKV